MTWSIASFEIPYQDKWSSSTCADPEGGGAWGPDPHSKNRQALGFLRNAGPDSLKIIKVNGHQPHARFQREGDVGGTDPTRKISRL